ncbi:hypothetical protein ACHAW5_009494 [Stephanodiscus triporus]|uniref:Cyclin-like domain-containing protein n=1 Tax=Stephanodiscus triporus TaxID=2934178 RepID=A0ABD3PZM7_9STRA
MTAEEATDAADFVGCVVVDRTVHATLPNRRRDPTPSAIDGIPPSIERLHRLHGTSLLLDASTLLGLPPSVYATSTTIFHRFYRRNSLSTHDVWSVSMGCMLLATKVEEECRAIRSIIATFVHLYRRRRLRYDDDDDGASSTSLTNDEKENHLRSVRPMPASGPAYAEWRDAMVRAEGDILVALGFTLHWMPDNHPHRFILYFARVLEIGGGGGGGGGGGREDDDDDDDDAACRCVQVAWNYCNDSCRTDLCVGYDPEVIACAAILMASHDHDDVDLPLTPRPWWEAFVGPGRSADMSTICNEILSIGDGTDADNRRSRRAYVPSLLTDGPSFNDPDSYLWSVS